jgi:hypothetical protein
MTMRTIAPGFVLCLVAPGSVGAVYAQQETQSTSDLRF